MTKHIDKTGYYSKKSDQIFLCNSDAEWDLIRSLENDDNVRMFDRHVIPIFDENVQIVEGGLCFIVKTNTKDQRIIISEFYADNPKTAIKMRKEYGESFKNAEVIILRSADVLNFIETTEGKESIN